MSRFAFVYEDPEYDTDDYYEMRVEALEDEGMTRSDAQAVVDAEMLQGVRQCRKMVDKTTI